MPDPDDTVKTAIGRLPRDVRAKLGHYVYLYRDPRNGRPFYVGKGVGERVLAHLDVAGDCLKAATLREIREAGREPELVIVRHGMTRSEAFCVEAVLIEHIGLEALTNKVAGHHTAERGAMTLDQVRSVYAAEPVGPFEHVALLIRVSRAFRHSMSPLELFEATCGTWKVGANRESVELAMAVYDGVVQEVYEVTGWQHGGTRKYETRDVGGLDTGRREFEGRVCTDAAVRDRYRLKNVEAHFPRGGQNPVRYVWPDAGSVDRAA